VLGTLLSSRLGTDIDSALPSGSPRLAALVAAGGPRAAGAAATSAQRQLTLAAVHHAYVAAFTELAVVGAVIVLVGAIVSLTLIRARDFALPAAVQPKPVAQTEPVS
jgi:hypothetical protein